MVRDKRNSLSFVKKQDMNETFWQIEEVGFYSQTVSHGMDVLSK